MIRAVAIVCLLSCLSAQGQLLTVSNTPVTLTTGAEVTVQGDVLLGTGAIITNHGNLRVLGDWTNDAGNTGITSVSTGQVLLYGGTQNIGGTNVTDLRKLIIEGGDKVLLQDAVVGTPALPDGILELNGAVLILNGRTFSVFNPASTGVVDGGGSIRSESPDLLSRFQWALGNDITEHRIPFTDAAGTLLPFAFTPDVPFPPNTLLSVATYATAPDNTPYPVTMDHQVVHMHDASGTDNSPNVVDRFWLTDLPMGAFQGTLLMGHAPADDPAFGPGPIRAQRWIEANSSWEAPLPGQDNPALREVGVPAVMFSGSAFPGNEHIWALAYELSPLPIELLEFDARPTVHGEVACTWITVSERDNDHFTVERSRDAVVFEEIGRVPGAGTSMITLHYAFDDERPYPGVSYYRLRQTDLDGTESWSRTVPVRFDVGMDISVYPNPTAGEITILRSDPTQALHLQLIDASGRMVQQWTMPAQVERQRIDLHAASGAYTLRWEEGAVKLNVSR